MSGNYPPIYLDDVLKFGKHKGATMRDVIEKHPEYIQWALDEQIIQLADDAYTHYAKIMERR
jgi:hypothetical protein